MGERTTPDGLGPRALDLVAADGTPETVEDWRSLASGLLTVEACAFHRNVEISAWYAWLHHQLPACFKWAGMAALASHHVRLALFPLRLDADRTGYVDVPRGLGRDRRLLIEDVNTIRATNNAIFDDIFWVHLAYMTADDGIGCLRSLLAPDPAYATVLAGFETIDEARRTLEVPSASDTERAEALDLVWVGNVQLLEHEQSALVQPCFDRLSCRFAHLISIGSATTFEVRGARRESAYFTSFYLSAMRRGLPGLRGTPWPRITRYEDRWAWIVSSVVPRFRRFDTEPGLLDGTLDRIFGEARTLATSACMPRPA